MWSCASAKITRWRLYMQQFEPFRIVHVEGRANTCADALSRLHLYNLMLPKHDNLSDEEARLAEEGEGGDDGALMCCLALRARPRTQGVSAPSNERFLSHGPAGCYPQTRQPPNCYNLTAHSTFSLRCWMEPGSQNRILAATQTRLTPSQQITTQSHVTIMTDLVLRTD